MNEDWDERDWGGWGWWCAEIKRARGRERHRGDGKERHPMRMPEKENGAGRTDRGWGPELGLPRLSAAAPITPLQGKNQAPQGGPEGLAQRYAICFPAAPRAWRTCAPQAFSPEPQSTPDEPRLCTGSCKSTRMAYGSRVVWTRVP